jgi:Concanavalin A-like lectin/glucanases superfamily
MTTGTTLFQLNLDRGQPFDGSTRGIAILNSTNVQPLAGDAGVQISGGGLDLARHPALDGLQTFTIHATVTPKTIAGSRRNIATAQTPGIALYLDPTGKLFGAVNTAQGWQTVDSGAQIIKENATASVDFSRDTNGAMTLQINGQTVGSKVVAGPLVNAGAAGFKIGADTDGKTFPFLGSILNFQIVQGVVTPAVQAARQATVQQVLAGLKTKATATNISVILDPDPALARLQKVRDILDAAGVSRLSDLSTLKLTVPVHMTPNKVLVAPKPAATVNWGAVAAEVAAGNAGTTRTRLAQYLTNRNSSAVMQKLSGVTLTHAAVAATAAPVAARVVAPVAAPASVGRLSAVVAQPSVAVRTTALQTLPETQRLTEHLQASGDTLKILNTSVLDQLVSAKPALWPVISPPAPILFDHKTIPVNSAVIIAQTLDLTNTTLLIDPTVTTLYIIAEEVICGPGASITWQQRGGTTPPRLDDPGLNGRAWSGIQTKADSKDGLPGGNGLNGTAGIDGRAGDKSPAIEMWVKNLTAIPNVSLDGEDGIVGGKGQNGGRGGSGGDAALGEKWWFFGWHCWSSGGDGGDGGDGGMGGRGGHGGNGGSGGSITIGTLQGTLTSTVTNKSFMLKNQGGHAGPGGPGGSGGIGGAGGRSGNGECCQDAHDGHHGAQGQPGAVGPLGSNPGTDAAMEFFEFTEADWDELLTRPWISKLQPTNLFPGDTLTIFGTAFTTADHIVVDGALFTPTVNADQSISMVVPMSSTGGLKSVSVRRTDGTESNRLSLSIKPQLDAFSTLLAPNATVSLTGHAFETGASVLVDGAAAPTTVTNPTSVSFTVPGTGGSGSTGGSVTVQVRNPDGWVSNTRTATKPRILEIPFQWGVNNFAFKNFAVGNPTWGTYEDTFGAAEVWHELLDPIFGHPILTAAFYGFYHYFLLGKDNGGLATGFCTSLASEIADRLWTGQNNTHTLTLTDDLRTLLTGVHGKLLSRQSLIHFHDQGRQGIARVEQTIREIEASFLRGCDRQSAPLLFFIPSGDIWDSGYFDKLSDSHCVMPFRFVYPAGHPGPQLSADGSTTTTPLDGVQMFVWDCNHPESQNCFVSLSLQAGVLTFKYIPDGGAPEFSSSDGITLGDWTNGNYKLGSHDLPFSGPLGLTTFIIEFLLSPADLQITDDAGNRTGTFGTQIRADIPGSHPCYLMKNMYMLPNATALTRTIVGNGTGKYTFGSVMPDNGSVVIENVPTVPGQKDVFSMSGDGTQMRFTAGADKTFNVTICRQVNSQARAIAVSGIGAAPGADIDLTVSPDLSLVRVGNQGVARTVQVNAFLADQATQNPAINKAAAPIQLPSQYDLVVAVPDWTQVNLSVQAVSFQ